MSHFSFFTWQWSDNWPKHVAGSNKLNVQSSGAVRLCTGLLVWIHSK
jgi:hypothetical protein